jgi:CheY-like chemotaxis protein
MDGKSALASISSDPPDLVILDIMLPGIDGFEVCRQIKGNPATRDIPVVMLTAKKSAADVALGEQVGANAYLTKPFKSAQVMEIIGTLLVAAAKKAETGIGT